MAAKKDKLTAPPEGRALQFSDLTPREQSVANEKMKEWGKQKSRVPGYRESLEKSSAKDKEESINVLNTIEPELRDVSVTLRSASDRRVGLLRQGAERVTADNPRSESRLRDVGAGWYFSHHQDLQDISSRHAVDKDRVIAASAVMSPMNSPSNEKIAVDALAHLHSTNPTLTLNEKAQRALGVSQSSINYSDLTSEQASLIGSPKIRHHISGVDQRVLRQQAKGGANKNVARAIDVMRGNIHHSAAIDPHGSPKVWSYHHSIAQSVPNTRIHDEYLRRADVALFNPNQLSFDLWGLKDSTEGPLNPRGHTASDTWEGAVSSGQPLRPVKGTRTSPAKVVASNSPYVPSSKVGTRGTIGTAGVSPEMVTHAWHNEANIRAAAKLSEASGEIVPATLSQEGNWTEARRVAEKDEEYKGRTSHFQNGHKQKQFPGFSGF